MKKADLLTWGRIAFFLFLIVSAGMVIYFPTYSRYKRLSRENEKIVKKIEAMKSEISHLQQNLDNVENDPYLLEKIARETIGVAKDDEIVVDIKD